MFYLFIQHASARDSRPLGHDVCKQCGSGACIQAWQIQQMHVQMQQVQQMQRQQQQQMQQTRSLGRGLCRIRRSHGPLQSCRPVILRQRDCGAQTISPLGGSSMHLCDFKVEGQINSLESAAAGGNGAHDQPAGGRLL